MKKIWLRMAALTLLGTITSLAAASSLYTDRYGNTTGEINGEAVSLYRDAWATPRARLVIEQSRYTKTVTATQRVALAMNP